MLNVLARGHLRVRRSAKALVTTNAGGTPSMRSLGVGPLGGIDKIVHPGRFRETDFPYWRSAR